jgi:hypothetical protein
MRNPSGSATRASRRFETEGLVGTRRGAGVLSYLFHRIEAGSMVHRP